MKRIILITAVFFTIISVNGQSIFGKWKTIDDKTGEAKSIVEIYEEDGKVFGKIIDILNPKKRDALCVKCKGSEKDQPVLGLVLIKNMQKDGEYYKKGTVFNPQNGKSYKCRIRLENANTLEVRGYVSFMYATQYWERVK